MFHWQHFAFDGLIGPSPEALVASPLWPLLAPFYERGWIAVDLFFCLSGFVFHWRYETSIATREVNAREFAVRRFARLWPLHLATLALVGLGQAIHRLQFGESFVSGNNDATHLLLNLLLVNAWGFEDGLSFNTPAWSISIEVGLYALFFLLARSQVIGLRTAVVAIVVGALIVGTSDDLDRIGRGLVSFFAGGLCCLLWQRMLRAASSQPAAAGRLRTAVIALLAATAAGWTFTLLAGADLPALADLSPRGPAASLLLTLGLFPLTVLTLALAERIARSYRATQPRRYAQHDPQRRPRAMPALSRACRSSSGASPTPST